MRNTLIVMTTVLFLACVNVSAAETVTVTVSSELARMRSADHLFRPQVHRILQYSGFNRQGSNPDRLHCLYEEEGWRVVADHKGPDVVTRIWTTHDTTWRDIQVEVDGKVIFTGKANRFFEQDELPFIRPLSEIRNRVSGRVTAEREVPGRKEWAVSYVPIPFERRFRYLQRDKVYANINCQPELDEHVFFDDERTFPDNSWNGTGHEDLFDMAWGHSPVSAPMTSGGSQHFEEVNVKLFWNNPMTFRQAIRFNWEWAFRFGVKPPRDARFASVVYWHGKDRSHN